MRIEVLRCKSNTRKLDRIDGEDDRLLQQIKIRSIDPKRANPRHHHHYLSFYTAGSIFFWSIRLRSPFFVIWSLSHTLNIQNSEKQNQTLTTNRSAIEKNNIINSKKNEIGRKSNSIT